MVRGDRERVVGEEETGLVNRGQEERAGQKEGWKTRLLCHNDIVPVSSVLYSVILDVEEGRELHLEWFYRG